MAINRAVVSGNLTRDPELKETATGAAVLEMAVAVNDRKKNPQTGEWEDYANFIDCTIFGSRAQGVHPYLSKGMHVTIEGKLRQRRWEKDGKKRSKISIMVDEIDFAGGKRQESGEQAEGGAAADLYDDDCPF